MRKITFAPTKTYATIENAEKAVANVAPHVTSGAYMIVACPETGRFAPVFFGADLIFLAHEGFTVVAGW